ncbi:hypothetical protein OSB04_032255 [Centaurea solstitialis]|uniref:Integrase catalytic domain-containing protein n=1 Tax=Centaurea solstitialis TaxID=347529 RepID=A0AA38VYD4_9ASTR|nr:hypothetical protein OSB04_032255 [Centaurea solstitialis]
MEMRIGARNKLGFLTGSTPKPKDEKKMEAWVIDNHRVKSWLIDSMSPQLMQRFIRLQTAKEIWEAVSKTFYDGTDETQLFELNRRSFTTRQNGKTLPAYYNELVSIFQEIDSRITDQEDDVNAVVSVHKTLARLRVHIFLADLDPEFNQARSEILRKDPPLDLESSYAYVRKDQNQRHTMEEPKSEPDGMVHLTTRSRPKGKNINGKGNTLTCTHCGEDGHSKQRCYEIIGYPDWWDFSKKPRKKIGQASVAATAKLEEPPTPVAAHVERNTSGMSNTDNSKKGSWIIDTGATDHMTNDPSQLISMKSSMQSDIQTANGGIAPVTCEGPAKVSSSMNLDTVLVVPSLSSSLLSVSQITRALNCFVTFWPDERMFQDITTRRILGYGIRRGKLYYLEEHRGEALNTGISEGTKTLAWLWHRRLGHLSFGYLRKLKPCLLLNTQDSDFKCDICEMAKNHRCSYAPIPFMTIHSNVWGPAQIATPNGARYFVTFIDECTRMVWISLLRHKGEVCHVFQELHRMVKSQYNCNIQVFQSDNGGEYINKEMHQFCKANSIRHQTSCAGTPQQNGLAERKNRQLLEVVRASLFDMKVPREYWGEAVRSAAYLINRTPSRVIDFQTPIQKLHRLVSAPMSPNLEPRVFGCTSYVHQNTGKLEPRAVKCVFLGYADHKKGYRCYDPKEQKMHVTRDVVFHENTPFFGQECSLHGEKIKNTYEENTHDHLEENVEETLDEPNNETRSQMDQSDEQVNETGSSMVDENLTNLEEDTIASPSTPGSTMIPQVTTDPTSSDTIDPSVLQENEPRYPARQNRGIPKNNTNLT